MVRPRDVVDASFLFQEWLVALKERAKLDTDDHSYVMFKAVLFALRRSMAPAQVLSFADGLPPLPRGIFLEGWRQNHELPSGSATTFLHDVRESLGPQYPPPDSIVEDVFCVLSHRCIPEKRSLMKSQLPDSLRSLWPDE